MVDYELIMHTDGPVRTCAACRTRRPQGALMRVARDPGGDVRVDTCQSRAPGRGAYLCRSVQCVELAARRQVLRRSFGVEIDAQIYTELRRLALLSNAEDAADHH